MRVRASRPSPIASLPALLLAAAIAISACGGDDSAELDPGNAAEAPSYERALGQAPPPLAKLYEEGGILLDGGLDAFEEQLRRLRGYPVVVNKWASWCGPCRVEFPHFQQQAAEHLDEVAFLGIDSEDSEAAAKTFLEGHPVPFPSFSDPDNEIAAEIRADFTPSTVFFDRQGEVVHVQPGVYADEAELAADVEKYALQG